MRFITEFEIDKNINHKLLPHIIPDKQHIRELGIGKDIGRFFGWQNNIVDEVSFHRLEIEAFPMDKWVDFKQKLFTLTQQSNIHFAPINEVKILELIKELESFCKSA